jgi:hypothetical protein
LRVYPVAGPHQSPSSEIKYKKKKKSKINPEVSPNRQKEHDSEKFKKKIYKTGFTEGLWIRHQKRSWKESLKSREMSVPVNFLSGWRAEEFGSG